MQNGHFALLLHHQQAQRGNDIECRHRHDQAKQQPHHVFLHAHRLEQLALALTPVFPLGAFRQRLLAKGVNAQRLLQEQTPAGDIARWVAHQT
ncbi:hypothetical protein D3C80_1864200 [compost metagenome]